MKHTIYVILAAVLTVGCVNDEADNGAPNIGVDSGGQIDTGAPDTGTPDGGMTAEDRGLGDDASYEGFAVDPFLVVAPNANTPLVAELTFETAEATSAVIELDDGTETRTLSFAETATEHRHLLLGLKEETTYTVTLTASGTDGAVATATGSFATAPLSELIPDLTTAVSSPADMEPGLTLFSVRTTEGGVLLVVDAAGTIVWVHLLEERLHDTRQLDNGNFLVGVNNRMEGREINARGDIVRRWVTSRHPDPPAGAAIVDTDSFHHEFAKVGDDDYIALSSVASEVMGYPTSEEDFTPRTETSIVVADVIVRFNDAGEITNEINLFDVLDTNRISYDGFGSYWDRFYDEYEQTFDWTHANGLVIDPADGNYIVTLKHQNAIVKMTPAGEVVWILAPPFNWSEPQASKVLQAQGPNFTYSYHIHAPEVTADGTLMLFDNHKYGTSPPTAPNEVNYSRGIEYRIDEANMTVTQEWVWDGAQDGLFAPIVGDTNVQPQTNNVLMTFGGLLPEEEGAPSAHIIEVARPGNEKVFELVVEDDNPEGPADRTVYRAVRIPSLYPPSAL